MSRQEQQASNAFLQLPLGFATQQQLDRPQQFGMSASVPGYRGAEPLPGPFMFAYGHGVGGNHQPAVGCNAPYSCDHAYTASGNALHDSYAPMAMYQQQQLQSHQQQYHQHHHHLHQHPAGNSDGMRMLTDRMAGMGFQEAVGSREASRDHFVMGPGRPGRAQMGPPTYDPYYSYDEDHHSMHVREGNDRLRGRGSSSRGKHRQEGGRQAARPQGRPQKGMEGKIKRTVYISSIDQKVTEADLAAFFSDCDRVQDCRICGDPNSAMRFAFIEFQTEEGVEAALDKTGTVLCGLALRVLPSKTAIVPVSRDLMPRSHDDIERCGRTVYVANIDKKMERLNVRHFFEELCGKISKLRLLGDHAHPTRIAFVEFQDAESAMAALNCSGALLGSLAIRVSPSKTPVRPDASHVELYDNHHEDADKEQDIGKPSGNPDGTD